MKQQLRGACEQAGAEQGTGPSNVAFKLTTRSIVRFSLRGVRIMRPERSLGWASALCVQ